MTSQSNTPSSVFVNLQDKNQFADSKQIMEQDDDQYARRFGGTKTLYGNEILQRFMAAHVYVIGVGGVGSWAAEALARTAVGELTLIDMDVLVASNINRQLPALDSSLGQSKIEAMAMRLRQINPYLKLNLCDEFITEKNVNQLLPSRQDKAQGREMVILDCTDDMNAKIHIALHCRFNKLKLVCAGGAGSKTDPTRIGVADLKDTTQDPLLARLRNKLRQEYGINRELKEKFGIRCVYSDQPPEHSKVGSQAHGLQCGGYGSAVVMTASMGMVMTSEALRWLARS